MNVKNTENENSHNLTNCCCCRLPGLYIIRRVESRNMRKKIASEGFETATDVLYPDRRRSFKKYRIGPIIPQ